MYRIVWTLLVLALLGCQQDTGVTSQLPTDSPPDFSEHVAGTFDQPLVDANLLFSFKLFDGLTTADPGANVFISSPSVAIALTMACNGADNETRTAMTDALELEGLSMEDVNAAYESLIALLESPDSAVELSIANSLWAREGLPFKEEFLQVNAEYYDAEVTELNFNLPEAAPTINAWVSDNTRGKIREIVDDPIDPAIIMFLINAIYFKGPWTYEFADSLTEDRAFTLLDGSTKRHPLMHQSGMYDYLRGDGFQAVSLPYSKGRVSMYVFLPDRESSLAAFQIQLTAANWKDWMASFQETKGDIALPRFTIEYETSLVDALSQLGMGIAFSESEADFGRMFPISPAANVYISDVKHKTFVEVNEVGTEAAAVTSVEFGVTAFPGPQPEYFTMTVDRPFFFAIRDNETGVLLFMGSIVDP
jgi:serpin B